MLNNTVPILALSKRDDYYISRWKRDTRSSAICISLVLGITFIAILHDLPYPFWGKGKDIFLSSIATVFLHAVTLIISLAIIIWLTTNKNTQKIISYRRYVFI